MTHALGRDAMARVLDALDLTGQSVVRLVIVCDVDDAVMVYVKRLIHEDQMDALADGLIEPAPREVKITEVGGLEVDEQGRVYVPASEVTRMRQALAEIRDTYDLSPAMRQLVGQALGRQGDG